MELKISEIPPSICLNMIVKNESHIIKETLKMLCNKITFSYWVICDTGSTDDTQKIITDFFKSKEIQGELHNHPWKNFAHNRTLALEAAFNKTDLLFVFDADDEIHGEIKIPKTFDSDGYLLNFGSSEGISYQRILLVNNRIKWNYMSVIHEYINCLKPNAKIVTLQGDYYVVSGRRGSRNSDPDKYIKDAKILEDAYHEAKKTNDKLYLRYGFYCANSYRDAGKPEEAIKWYRIVLNNDNWFQEKYVSCLYIYYEYHKIGEKEKGFYYLVESFKYDTERAECVYILINHYMLNGQYNMGYQYYELIRDFYENKYLKSKTNDKLFVEPDKSNFFLPYYMILIADKVKETKHEAKYTIKKMFEIIFTQKYRSNDEFYIGNLLYNLQFFIEEHNNKDFLFLFQSYIDFLESINYNLWKHKFMTHFEKYGIKCKSLEQQITNNIFSNEECKNSNKILFYTGFSNLPWNYTYSINNALGGSETAVAYLAKSLPNNFEIYVCGEVSEEKVDNISYIHLDNIHKLVKSTPFHTLIVSRYIAFYEMFSETSFYQSFIWGHDIGIYHYGCNLDVNSILEKWNSKINGCVCQSEWHKNLFSQQYPQLKDKIFTINNGILVDKFIFKPIKFSNRFIYTSCAERGLDRLLELWPLIIENLPDAELFICSYNKFPQNDYEKQLDTIIKNHESIKHVGCLNRAKLYELMSSAEFWLYPTNFNETSCITSMEMLMSEVICIYYPIAGLVNTLGDYGIPIERGNELNTILYLSTKQKLEIRKRGKEYALSCSWNNRANEWSKIINFHLLKNNDTIISNIDDNTNNKNNITDISNNESYKVIHKTSSEIDNNFEQDKDIIINYGTKEVNIDITEYVFNNLINNGHIQISNNDDYRASLFGDPIYGALKSIFITDKEGQIIEEYKHNQDVDYSIKKTFNSNCIKIINLKRREDRKKQIITQFEQNNIKDYEFIEAIDGLELEKTDELIKLFNNNNFENRKGVIGCALSHLKLWNNLINDTNNEYYVILEDDLELCDNFKEKLIKHCYLFQRYNLEHLSLGVLECNYELQKTIHTDNINIIKKDVYKFWNISFAYIISKNAAKKIIDFVNNCSIKCAIDNPRSYGDILVYHHTTHCIAKQQYSQYYGTDINNNNNFFFENQNIEHIKIAFCDWWHVEYCGGYFDINNNFITNILTNYSNIKNILVVNPNEQPDYLFYSIFGSEHTKYNNVRKIFYSGEPFGPSSEADFNITFNNTTDKNYRYPLWLSYTNNYLLEECNRRKNGITNVPKRTNFCSFISNGECKTTCRRVIVEKLSKYKRVDCGGAFLNNIGYTIQRGTNCSGKIEHNNNYKFAIAFENEDYPGYVTEKICDIYKSNCIPIYWGNKEVLEDFNPNTFIYAKDFYNFDELVDYIIKVDNDDELYASYFKEPFFSNKWMDIFNDPYNTFYKNLADCILGYNKNILTNLFNKYNIEESKELINVSVSNPLQNNVIFLNTSLYYTGVYHYGKRLFDIVKKSKKYNYTYFELDTEKEYNNIVNNLDSTTKTIIYNTASCLWKWMTNIHKNTNVTHMGFLHEEPLKNINYLYDVILNIDSTLTYTLNNYPILRPIYEDVDSILTNYKVSTNTIKEFIDYKINDVPIFGSFGFGFYCKGFENIVSIVNNEYDEAIIKIIMTYHLNDMNDNNQIEEIKQTCNSNNVKPNIKLLFIHEFFSNEDLLLFLNSNTANIFMYQDNMMGRKRSISSVIDYALSVDRPICISNSMMFNHIYNDNICLNKVSINECIKNYHECLDKIKIKYSNNNLIKCFDNIIDANVIKKLSFDNLDNIDIKYGLNENTIDITHYLHSQYSNNIFITDDDNSRASIFGDPIFGTEKHLYLSLNNKSYSICQNFYININTISKTITFNNPEVDENNEIPETDNKMKIIFANNCSIGDIYFSQPFIKNIVQNNPQYHYYIYHQTCSYYFTDLLEPSIKDVNKIPELKELIYNIFDFKIDIDKLTNIHNLSSYVYRYNKEHNILIICTWLGILREKYEIIKELDMLSYNKGYELLINDINFDLNVNLIYDNLINLNLYPCVSHLDITKFKDFKEINSDKKIIFYYNFLPSSGQSFPIKDDREHIEVIKSLNKNKNNIIVLTKKYKTELQFENIYYADDFIDNVEYYDAKNFYFHAEMANISDYSIYYEIGRGFMYMNRTFIEENNSNIRIHISNSDRYDYYSVLNSNELIPNNYTKFIKVCDYQDIIDKLNNIIKPDIYNNLSIMAIFKNETMNLKLWIDHYLWQGVEHFYLIDNGSTDEPLNILSDYINKGILTYYYRAEKYQQVQHYMYVYDNENIKDKTRWLCICDLDEFFFGIDDKLVKLLNDFENYDVIYTNSHFYGSDNLIEHPNDIRTAIINREDDLINGTKYIFKPTSIKNSNELWIHWIVNENTLIKKEMKEIWPFDKIRLNHYRIQSYEYFTKIKMNRGDVSLESNENIRDLNYFENYKNRATIKDELLKQIVENGYKYNNINETINTALIVEPRLLNHLPFVINDFNKKLGFDWKIVFYCGKGLKNIWIELLSKDIEIRELNTNYLSYNEYSDFMKKNELWNSLYGKYILVFSADSLIKNTPPYTINYFTTKNYSYIGGNQTYIWNELQRENIYFNNYNFQGGLSLRNRYDMIKIINHFGVKNTITDTSLIYTLESYAEDIYFTIGCHKLNLKLGDDSISNHFSIHCSLQDDFFGVNRLENGYYINLSTKFKSICDNIYLFKNTQTIDNEMLYIHPSNGFFSNCSLKLFDIIIYFNCFKKLPLYIDSSQQFELYKNETNLKDLTYEYFDHNMTNDIEYSEKVDFFHEYQYINYDKLCFKKLTPFIDKYFSPSTKIRNLITYIENKYEITDYNNICVLFYRGNDKITEKTLPSYDDILEKAREIYNNNNNITFLIQSDEKEFINKFTQEFSNNSFYFKDEIRTINKNNNLTVDRIVVEHNFIYSQYYLAITIIMSKCKYVVCNTGNCSLWITLYRGNSKNIIQLL